MKAGILPEGGHSRPRMPATRNAVPVESNAVLPHRRRAFYPPPLNFPREKR